MSRVSSCSSLGQASDDPANNWAMMWGQINEGDEIGLPSGGGGGAAAGRAVLVVCRRGEEGDEWPLERGRTCVCSGGYGE